jgi:hypothetical protein
VKDELLLPSDPVGAGVPEMDPVALSNNPAGNIPVVITHV